MGIFDWALSAAQNQVADPRVAAQDGASARSFPGSLRTMMASIRALADDQGGAITTGGTLNAYTVRTASGVRDFRPGVRLVVRADRANTAEASLNVDGSGPRPWLDADGKPFGLGRIRRGRAYAVLADPDGAWHTEVTDGTIESVSGLDEALETKVNRDSFGDTLFRTYFGGAPRSPAERARVPMDLRDFNGADPKGENDSLGALDKLFEQIPSEGANIHIPGGLEARYAFSAPPRALRNRNNIRIFGHHAVLDASNFPKGANNSLITISGTVSAMADAVPVVVSVSRFSRFITVAPGQGSRIAVGVPFMLCSTGTHIGIPGQSGYGRYRSGQWLYPRKIDGDVIECDDFPVDSYPVDAENTVVIRPAVLCEGVEIDGLRFKGPGRGDDYQDPSQVPPEVMPFDIEYAWGVTVNNCRFRDFAKFAGYISRSYNVRMTGNGYVGRDLRTPSNQASAPGKGQSDRFTGAYIVSCQHVLFGDSHGEGLRRLFDCGSNGVGDDLAPVGRFILVYACSSTRSYGGLGSHAGDRITYAVCRVEMASNGGIGLRATNGRILGCTFEGIGTANSAVGVTRVGGAFSLDYPETARSGDWEFSYNYVNGADTVLHITGDFNRGVARGNTMKNIRGHAIEIHSKKWDSLEIDGGLIDMSARGTKQVAAIYQEYQPGKGIAPGSLKVRLTIENAWRGVILGGGDQRTPFDKVDLDIAFNNCESSNIHTGDPFTEADGYFGPNFSYGKSKSYTKPADGFRTGRQHRFAAEPTCEGIEQPDVQPYVVRYVASDPILSPPNSGTFLVGHQIERFPPLPYQPNKWLTVLAGTRGSATHTGSAAADQATVVLTTAFVMPLGTFVLVPGADTAGATLRAQVKDVSVDGLTVTLDRNIRTAVAGAAITLADPVFMATESVGLGNLETRTIAALPTPATVPAGTAIWCADLGGGGGVLRADAAGWRRESESAQNLDMTGVTNTLGLTHLEFASTVRLTGTIQSGAAIQLGTSGVPNGSTKEIVNKASAAISVGGLSLATNTAWKYRMISGAWQRVGIMSA